MRISHRPYGFIQAYATITTSGKSYYNEDRIGKKKNQNHQEIFSLKIKKMPLTNCSILDYMIDMNGIKIMIFLRNNQNIYIYN